MPHTTKKNRCMGHVISCLLFDRKTRNTSTDPVHLMMIYVNSTQNRLFFLCIITSLTIKNTDYIIIMDEI